VADVDLVGDSGGPGSVLAPVTWVDRFGNVQLQLSPASLATLGMGPGATVRVFVGPDRPTAAQTLTDSAHTARWVGAFAHLHHGELGLLADANGAMALVLDRASAAQRLEIGEPGTPVRIWIEAPASALPPRQQPPG
jgi:S-adenosylmethionine hydrolase